MSARHGRYTRLRETKLADIWPPPNWQSWEDGRGGRFVIDSTWGFEGEHAGRAGRPVKGELFLTDTLDGTLIEHRRVTLRTLERTREKLIERAKLLNLIARSGGQT